MKRLTPKDGETLPLLRQNHLDYIRSPQNDPVADVDWLHLREGKEDLSYPLPVTLTYSPEADGEVRLSRAPDMKNAEIFPAKGGKAEVWNLEAGKTYYWQAAANGVVSDVGSFRTDAAAPRMLYVDGISNVRDAGGFAVKGGGRVRQGMIYRTSEMDRHVHITEEGKKELYRLGMKTDLDIRGAGECPVPILDRRRVAFCNVPLAAYDAVFTPEQMARYRETVELLCRPSVYPLFVHCWGGIDRTGTWLYVIGGMLGMSEDDLGLDYEMSSFSRWGRRSRRSDQFRAFLSKLHEYGDDTNDACVGFLRACGVTDEEMRIVRDLLIEK